MEKEAWNGPSQSMAKGMNDGRAGGGQVTDWHEGTGPCICILSDGCKRD